MLNRQTVKNVTLPLAPGEMKLTVVDAATLQVARRGESELNSTTLCHPELKQLELRRGIWFSEGSEAVERFRATILR